MKRKLQNDAVEVSRAPYPPSVIFASTSLCFFSFDLSTGWSCFIIVSGRGNADPVVLHNRPTGFQPSGCISLITLCLPVVGCTVDRWWSTFCFSEPQRKVTQFKRLMARKPPLIPPGTVTTSRRPLQALELVFQSLCSPFRQRQPFSISHNIIAKHQALARIRFYKSLLAVHRCLTSATMQSSRTRRNTRNVRLPVLPRHIAALPMQFVASACLQ